MTLRKNQSAFTLLEIMLVVTIIALLLGAAIYKLGGNVEYSRHVRVAADIQGINTQLKLYESMNGFFPTTEQGLQALVVQPGTDPKPTRWYQLQTGHDRRRLGRLRAGAAARSTIEPAKAERRRPELKKVDASQPITVALAA